MAVIAIDARLIAEARALLNRARLIPEARAMKVGEGGHGHQDSTPPPGLTFSKAGLIRERSTLEQMGERIARAIASGSDEDLRAANEWAAGELRALQHGPPNRGPESREQFEYRLATEYEGVPAARAASRERTSETTVRNARTKHGRTAARGLKPPGAS